VNYDINACDLVFGGVPLKDNVVSFQIAPDGPAYTKEKGASGEITRCATNEKGAKCTVTLKGGSIENEKLSAIHAGDVGAKNGQGILPFYFNDHNGASLVSTDKAWIEGMAPKTFGATPGDTTWVIDLVLDKPLEYVIGGN
jgi:hypothetical protein